MAVPNEMVEQVSATFRSLSLVQKVIGGMLLLAVAGGLLGLVFLEKKTDHQVLFSGLAQEDAAEVISRLKEQRIPYQLTGNGSTILVPADHVYETRLSLAGEGMPRGGSIGFEIFDATSFGTTDFVQRLNYQRALQGELARTIRRFEQVAEARVHIATPKESVFIEDQKSPTASVSVRLQGRETLSKTQIQSIVNLVASAVPGLTPENITVVDTAGRLLFHRDGDKGAMFSATQLEYQMTVEETLRKKVESLLAGAVGPERVQARVTAEIDFSRVNFTEENFDPDGKVVRSEQLLTEEDRKASPNSHGIPGVKGELASFDTTADVGFAGNSHSRNNITRNYEISRTTRHVQEATGTVRRLSVAVMVDGVHEKAVDKEGTPGLIYRPRTAEEMQWFEKIVKNAIGYDEDRGDRVEVVNVSFALPQVPEIEIDPMDQWRGLAERLAMPLLYFLLAMIFFLMVVRPFFRLLTVKQMETQQRGGTVAANAGAAGANEEDLAWSPRGVTNQERIYKLAQSDPSRAADLVRRWLREEP
jgi:flagellar M-ring protein FliF